MLQFVVELRANIVNKLETCSLTYSDFFLTLSLSKFNINVNVKNQSIFNSKIPKTNLDPEKQS
ncbi:hypothetical protein GCM10011518_38380 [Flavobacterium limi]|uniref:Uncharacterized protein n=1 Tax=Flavobacterium limi TaxID=2045105 RepID=A0ABQ1USU0_9FLAO|nr:hypothetical protein GCM10011518_38380 [Flavobacterium limi]